MEREFDRYTHEIVGKQEKGKGYYCVLIRQVLNLKLPVELTYGGFFTLLYLTQQILLWRDYLIRQN